MLNSTLWPGNIVADLEYGANGYLGDRESSTTGSLLTYDPLGNTVHYTNYSGGINTTSLPTGAFGTIGGTNVPTRDFGFQHDLNYSYNAASGLEALGARLYDPRSGRFINRDPIRYAGGINVYGYAGSNPVNGMDPSGLAVLNLGGTAGVGVGWQYVGVSGGVYVELPFAGSNKIGFGLYGTRYDASGLGLGGGYGLEAGEGYGNLNGFSGDSRTTTDFLGLGDGFSTSHSESNGYYGNSMGVRGPTWLAGAYSGKSTTGIVGFEWTPDLRLVSGPRRRPPFGTQESDWGTGLPPLNTFDPAASACSAPISSTGGSGGGTAY